jgi:hypothetical protein
MVTIPLWLRLAAQGPADLVLLLQPRRLEGYYPYVTQCKTGWAPVPANYHIAPPASRPGGSGGPGHAQGDTLSLRAKIRAIPIYNPKLTIHGC